MSYSQKTDILRIRHLKKELFHECDTLSRIRSEISEERFYKRSYTDDQK